MEPSNNPRYVKNTRRIRISSSSSDSETLELSSSSTDKDLNDSDEEVNGKKSYEKSLSRKLLKNLLKKKRKQSLIQEKDNKITPNEKNEISIKKIPQQVMAGINPFFGFKEHIPKWGALFKYNGVNIHVTDTCTIDYFLFGFWILSQIVPNFIRNIPELEKTDALKNIVTNINIFNWNKVRELWIFEVIGHNFRNLKSISLFGSEYTNFLRHISDYQKYKLQQQCTISCSENNRILQEDSTELYFRKTQNNGLTIFSSFSSVCHTCESFRSIDIRFDYSPNFIFFQINNVNGRAVSTDVPKHIDIDNTEFQLLCVTVHQTSPSHFCGIY